MTGFCGVFDRLGTGAITSDLIGLATQALSRRASDKVHVFAAGQFFLCYFDNLAFRANAGFFESADSISCVSGSPLVVAQGGDAYEIEQSAEAVSMALSAREDGVLSGTAGSFAALSWSKATASLTLAADKLALRPIYVYLTEAICAFATNLRTLRLLAPRNPEIDERGLSELLVFGYPLGNRTVFRNVVVLRPAEILAVTAKTWSRRRYFKWGSIKLNERSEADVCAALYEAFTQAIRRRSHSNLELALLSGGLDSRCVVGGLLDIGRTVRTFCSAYPNSADHVISKIAADALGTPHTVEFYSPADQLKKPDMGLFAFHVRRGNYLDGSKHVPFGRVLWSGDGGSVCMGHVYMDNIRQIRIAAGKLTDEEMQVSLPALKQGAPRVVTKPLATSVLEQATIGAREEFENEITSNSDRKLFLFYLLNDQSRHLYAHYEDIDLHGIEFQTPFFDPEFLSIVIASPVGMFLRHELYNKWLACFQSPVGKIPWQVYPGHFPCPLPMPEGITLQWNKNWYKGDEARSVACQVASMILNSRDRRLRKVLSFPAIRFLRYLNLLGIERYNYNLWLARRVFTSITGCDFEHVG